MRRIKAVIIAVIITLAIAGVSGIIADQFGFDATQSVFACDPEGSSGGGC